MTSDDGMDWLDAAPAAREPTPAERRDRELDAVGSAARLALYNTVRATFDRLAESRGLTRRQLAERLGGSSELVARLLRRPSNMTIETAAKLMFCMGEELSISRKRPAAVQKPHESFRLNFAEWKDAGWLFMSSCVFDSSQYARSGSSNIHVRVHEAGGLRSLRLTGSECHGVDGVYEQIEITSKPVVLGDGNSAGAAGPRLRLKAHQEAAHV
jgi:hypothetical protein